MNDPKNGTSPSNYAYIYLPYFILIVVRIVYINTETNGNLIILQVI